ncbi:hypothetical protein F0562_022796 [Nyssa sinensis]|uniref:Uncharacterized protein n=1 Tax=Nyssa sinensis TaxID=561372 RepID=A0A5J5BG10_9ASTE|nr:hypothetical protein F0562_022796 [Nyssa sinensis]
MQSTLENPQKSIYHICLSAIDQNKKHTLFRPATPTINYLPVSPMDSIVSAALEEICSQGVNGLTLSTLWPKLHLPVSSHGLHLCSNVKKAIWSNILNVPGLHFEARNVSYDSQDPSIQALEDSEKLNLRITAAEHLRNSFVGIYDIKASDAGISQTQRRALERLAIARENGITQSELAKEFGMKGNNIFYVLRNLECRGLIVRQSTIVRTKEACNEGESKNSSIVSTNMLHLYRYAKHLGCQQRLEITKEDKTLAVNENAEETAVSGVADECVKENVHVKDFLPALKAICDKLEQADGKVLVVSDVKRDLGYRGNSGHRAWRNICNRLKDARVVEEFCAKVNKKEVSCLRLLKKFTIKNFEPKSLGCGYDDIETEQLVKLGKRGQITDQLVELPIEHQIYDMIDAEGSKGLTITEVCKRLGINNKRYYTRLLNMFSRFGMHLQAESHNRGVAYRVWTSGNFNPEASNTVLSKSENVFDENGVSNPCIGDLAFHEKSTQTVPDRELDLSTSKADIRDTGRTENRTIEPELSPVSLADGDTDTMLVCSSNPQKLACELHGMIPDAELPIVNATTVSNVIPLETSPPALSTPPRPRSYQRYPCLSLTAVSAQREQRILQRLQEEKFIIRAELRRQLESLEKDKHTMMDRRTLDRTLNKLQQEGHCKCIRVSVPVVTNCGRSRITEVVLHPSVHNVSPELLGEIHDRMRSFEMEIRGQSSSRLKKGESVPVLNGVQRILNSAKLDVHAERSEAMRANGFILAKMVRTKLLHIFLWGYLSSSPGWDDAFSSGKHGYDLKNPHSTCKLFVLDAAIKAMPLELFLQVVGSTQKFEDMIEKCRIGLRLSDLSEQEYKHLMDTQATGRLSWIIDILRRLKLIRLVSDGHSEDVAEVPHTTLTHALELKPYIEEPVLILAPSSNVISLDLRPQIRHDFILSSRKAVDEYWNTLEYCYAAADSKAALHAFPGSVVHEVFLFRSWASVRVMTADQRAELLKCIVNDDPNKKLSFKDCEKIAKDLNLTLEQVLRIYYDKRQQRLTRFRGNLNAKWEELQTLKRGHASSSRKRKRSSEGRLSKHIEVDTADEHLGEQRLTELSDTNYKFTEEPNILISSGEQDSHSQAYCDDGHMEAIEAGLNEESEEQHAFIHECAHSRLKPTRQRKFSWTEEAERQLVIEYVRHRAALGAKFHRTDWASLPDLPAPPDACKRRMALLNSNIKFRKSVMRLCNMLSERYAMHLVKSQNKLLSHGDCRVMVQDSSFGKDCDGKFSDGVERPEEELGLEKRWDYFDNKNIKIALDEVLRYKRMAKLEASKGGKSVTEEWSDLNMDAESHDPQGTELVSSSTREEIQNHGGRNKVSGRRSSWHRLPGKYTKLLNEGVNVNRRVYESLAVSNASELFKLVFLSTSMDPEVPYLLAETLRRYSERDLFAAFNYLREKKIMVRGNGSNPFVLSQQFLQSISSSPFPTNTGKRAARFAGWLHEREKDLVEEGVDLTPELQCGDIFHLCALLSLGELLISPCLPDEGVGEAEDSRASKRKSDNSECDGNKSKKLKSSSVAEGEIISRREKGFPGIRLSLTCATISRVNAVELFKDENIHTGTLLFGENGPVNTTSSLTVVSVSSHSDHMVEILNFGSTISTALAASESPWEAMTNYAKHLVSLSFNQEQVTLFYPELFRTVYSAIQKAGDQGLCMEEVSQALNMQGVFSGEKMPELIVEVLEVFGRVLKVNSYDSVHVVDSLYQSKYFLNSANLRQDLKVAPPVNSKGIIDDGHLNLQLKNHDDGGTNSEEEIFVDDDEVHKVTILNLPEKDSQPSSEVQSRLEGCMQPKLISAGGDHEGGTFKSHSVDSYLCRPILPWLNGDGTINKIVYKGLVRRVLGIVMQHPGIKEDDILSRMDVLNPQSCRKLLELMILDNHINVRMMQQTPSGEPPTILGSLLGGRITKSKLICRKHFFANPMSTAFL